MTSFKTDENLPEQVADLLRQAGFDARTVLDQSLGGKPDPRIAEVCRDEGRALITLDLDFADIRVYPPFGSPGVIVLRPATQSIRNIVLLTRHVIAFLASEPLAGRLWIVDDNQVRIRE
jgi:predicted nuclease of predicted toxin-antitoxin system